VTARLVVVGGDAGGMSAAATARRRRDRADLEILAFERGAFTSYSACGIPYLVGGVVRDADTLIARTVEEHRAHGIDVRVRHDVLAVDLAARTVRVRDLDAGREETVGFDHLVLATGASPVRPDIPGVDAHGVFGVQHLDDGLAIRHLVADEEPRTAVVVGAGYIGIEMAEAFLSRGLRVVMVDRAAHPMPTLDPDMGALVADAIRRLGIDLRLECTATGLTVEDGRVRAVQVAGEEVPADVVVFGLGVRPNRELAEAAGIDIGETGGVRIDDHTRTSAPEVYAAGDCVETYHRVSRRPVAIALGTHANKQGRVAGVNITGGDATFPGVIGTAVAKVCALEVGRTGLTERMAAEAGFSARGVRYDGTTRAGYFPGVEEIRVKLVVEEGTGRLLGAQVVGKEGAAKRVDVLAVCIWNEMTVEEVMELDLGYAPPFAPLWDPVVGAARAAVAELG
jgi:NADPH-dependent 2,4-dienoyl-CoA reductase/sulfur reductase-like enzyme